LGFCLFCPDPFIVVDGGLRIRAEQERLGIICMTRGAGLAVWVGWARCSVRGALVGGGFGLPGPFGGPFALVSAAWAAGPFVGPFVFVSAAWRGSAGRSVALGSAFAAPSWPSARAVSAA